MNIDPSSILRPRDMNQVQRDIIGIIFQKIKNTPKSQDWSDFNEVISYKGRRFKVEMTYRFNDFFLEFQRLDYDEAPDKIVTPKYIHYSKGER